MRGRLKSAFTLVEVLVVIGIIGIVVGMVVPAIGSVRAEAHSTQCLSNLRQIYVAIQSFRAGNNDVLPIAAVLQGDAVDPDYVMLAERLDPIMPRTSEIWMCPADQSQDSLDIGTSYFYSAGGWMQAEPMLNRQRVAEIITLRYERGYLRTFPLVADDDLYHRFGSRYPCNGVFIDGQARVTKVSDFGFVPDEPHQLPGPTDPTGPSSPQP
jgi:prepilin-type N-terminal cleavage/methylation domain-containing protein